MKLKMPKEGIALPDKYRSALIAFLFLLIANFSFGQTYTYQKPTVDAKTEKRLNIDSVLLGPTICGAPSALNRIDSAKNKVALVFDSCNHRLWVYDPKLKAWDSLHLGVAGSGGGGTDSSIRKGYGIIIDISGTNRTISGDSLQFATILRAQHLIDSLGNLLGGKRDSARQHYIGPIINQNNWPSLTGYTVNGANAAASGGKIVFSEATGGSCFETVDYDYVTAGDYWSIGGKVTLLKSTGIFAFGIRPLNDVGFNVMARVLPSTGYVDFLGYCGNTISRCDSNISMSVGQQVEIILQRQGANFKLIARNITTGAGPYIVDFTYNTNIDILPSTGKPAIFAFGDGTTDPQFQVDSFYFVDQVITNASLGFKTDSKWAPVRADFNTSAVNLLAANNTMAVFTNPNDKMYEFKQGITQILNAHPKQLLVSIGCNDIRTGRSVHDVMVDMDSVYNVLTAAGINVIVANGTREQVLNLAPLKDSINAHYGSNVLNTWDISFTPGFLASDSIHIPNYGQYLLNNLIKNSGLFNFPDYQLRDVSNKYIFNSGTVPQNAAYNITGASTLSSSLSVGNTTVTVPLTVIHAVGQQQIFGSGGYNYTRGLNAAGSAWIPEKRVFTNYMLNTNVASSEYEGLFISRDINRFGGALVVGNQYDLSTSEALGINPGNSSYLSYFNNAGTNYMQFINGAGGNTGTPLNMRASTYSFNNINAGSVTNLLTLASTGATTLSQYGVGTFTGTPAKFAAWTAGGAFIERTAAELLSDIGAGDVDSVNSKWSLLGNFGTTNTAKLGTKDNTLFNIITNNTNRITVHSDGRIQLYNSIAIGATPPSYGYIFDILESGTVNTRVGTTTAAASGGRAILNFTEGTGSASTLPGWRMGLNASAENNSDFMFDELNSGVFIQRWKVQNETGYFGINKTAPAFRLHVGGMGQFDSTLWITTEPFGDSTDKAASTAFVQDAIASSANLGNSDLTQSSSTRQYTIGYNSAAGQRYLSLGKLDASERTYMILAANSTNHNGAVYFGATDSTSGVQTASDYSPTSQRIQTAIRISGGKDARTNYYLDSLVLGFASTNYLTPKKVYNFGADSLIIKGNMGVSASSSDSVLVRGSDNVIRLRAQSDIAGGGGGSGTVNSGNQYRLAYYATTGTAVSEAAAITASRALVSDANGVPTHATTTATEIGYVNGVTSAIQTQLNGKQSTITFGTGVQTALGVNIGSAGAPVLFNGAGGTPSSLTGTNITGTATGLTAGAVNNALSISAELISGGATTYNGSAAKSIGIQAGSVTNAMLANGAVANLSGTNTGDQNLFSSIPVAGQTTVTANSATTALTLVAGSNMTITTNNTTKEITLAATGGGSGLTFAQVSALMIIKF